MTNANGNSNNSKGYTVEVQEDTLSGSLWGWDSVNVPVIQYTPEEIFSNRVPALDINFISPSIRTGNTEIDQKMNVAIKLQPVISSWYIAIRTLAIVGLLSVLVYLGIRMLLSGIAADKAKYKKMLMDWLVAMCLVFALHYIMSLALTLTETITSMIAGDGMGAITVQVKNGTSNSYSFRGNLMSYVRFMIQSTEASTGLSFLALYIMLVIYNIRFTWTYLKRVVNMAFLTLISPVVALTYPIDKVSDGKAQAFDLWIKEFTFNAIIQPLHLFLYVVLLSSATELAVINPLYAIVCLGFILAAEKLLKQMFNFGKAGGGTVGSLAGAAGVSALAHKALMSFGKGPHGKGGAPGKVRTNDKYQREGKNTGANKGYNSFDQKDNKGLDELTLPEGMDAEDPAAQSPEGTNLPEGSNIDPTGTMTAGGAGVNQVPTGAEEDATIDPTGSPDANMTQEGIEAIGSEKIEEPETVGSLWKDDWKKISNNFYDKNDFFEGKLDSALHTIGTKEGRKELGRKASVGAYKRIRGVAHAAPTAMYKAARGTLKTGARLAAGAALGAVAGVIGATTGDAEKAISMAGAGFALGGSTGGKVFESTMGKAMPNKSVRDSYGAGKYGSAIDARNEKADKAYLKSQEHQEEYEKYFKEGKNKMTKTDFNKATKAYREAGITDKKAIRNALKLEKQYLDAGHDGGNIEKIRGKVQNIVQSYDYIDKKAVYGDEKATVAALRNIESQLTKGTAQQKRATAKEILQGYRDFYNVG